MAYYSFDTDLAKEIGVDEAIMVHNLAYWISHNKANRKNFHDNRYWTYNTVEAFTGLFNFWTAKQLRRIMQSLYDQNVVIKGNYNANTWDRTGWYSLTDKYDYLLVKMQMPNQEIALAEKDNTIPYSKPDTSSFKKNKRRSVAGDESKIVKKFIPPTLEEVKAYFKERGYTSDSAKVAFDYYEAGKWHDQSGKPVKNWKQKMISSWMKPENQIQAQQSQTGTLSF